MTRSDSGMPASLILISLICGPLTFSGVPAGAGDCVWKGSGRYRLLVEVPAVTSIHRSRDELIARAKLDLARQFPDAPADHRIDLHSLQVIRQDDGSGPYPRHAQQKSPEDRPFRFYDQSLGDEFPTWRRYASLEAAAGRELLRMPERLPFGHRVFQPVGPHRQGTLVWAHTQDNQQASTYGIYFDLVPESSPQTSPPAGWLGDGGNRIVPQSRMAGPPGNNSGTITDWNSDGLPDVLYGLSSGYIIVAENTGTERSPAFNRRRILYDQSGQPIDAGYDSCPLAVDWNSDGLPDLLIGAAKGCILYFENVGKRGHPSFTLRRLLQADGATLLTPNWPIAELAGGQPGAVFSADYLAIPHVCDWDGDGDIDLLAGGFVTGMVYFFENTGVQDDGTPRLSARGPLTSDGQFVDVGWAAAPVAVDLDDDGDLDLLVGGKPMTEDGGDTSDRERNLSYFENTGSRSRPVLLRRRLPATGPPPTGTTLMAGVCDFNRDSRLDLLLITRSAMDVFAIPNVGSRTHPHFDMRQSAIAAEWSHQQLPSGVFIDWNHDGHADLMNRFEVLLNDGSGLPFAFGQRLSVLSSDQTIQHPVPHGDENSFVTLHDFDHDGDHDCIYGAHSGHIWFHENRGSDKEPDMDTEGYELPLAAGGLVRVGEPPADQADQFNFTVLQGARPKPAPADFDGDGHIDLVIGDTYGRVRYFRNAGRDSRGRHTFESPRLIHQSRSRLSVHAADWDGDSRPDVFIITGQRVHLMRNTREPSGVSFSDPKRLLLPPTIGGFYGVSPVDLNGDGDVDLVYNTSSRITCYVERSFLEYGYRTAEVIGTSKRTR